MRDRGKLTQKFTQGMPNNYIDGLIRQTVRFQIWGEKFDAEEVIQNTRLALLSCFKEVKYKGKGLTTYVCRIAAIQSVMEMRRHYRSEKYRAELTEQIQQQPDPTENPVSTIVGRERKDMAITVLKTLGKLCRQLLMLKFYKGLSYSEMGARLGLTEVNARVSTHRCLQKSKEMARKMEENR